MTIITGEKNILSFRDKTLLMGLGLEIKGMKLSRNKSCYAIIKNQYGLKGNKRKVYEQFKNLLLEKEHPNNMKENGILVDSMNKLNEESLND
tara:strand:+ start:167 stop:442 length:276 start_codon:yes stop_codon:yes gene_type:complete